MKVWIGATLLLCLLAKAEAAPLYTTTDLGAGYQLRVDGGGQVHGVAGANGAVYAFDKASVTSINLSSYLPDGSIHYVTLQEGSRQASYNNTYAPQVGPILYPAFMSLNSGWFIQPNFNFSTPPVSDINGQGQVIGISQYSIGQTRTYAGFSDVNGQNNAFSGNASIVDNLNEYIATIPGVSLTSAVKIDDLGRIIAVGSDGHDYLLTPVALGAASPVPEPTTVVTLGLLASLLGFRSIRRRRQR